MTRCTAVLYFPPNVLSRWEGEACVYWRAARSEVLVARRSDTSLGTRKEEILRQAGGLKEATLQATGRSEGVVDVSP